MNILNAENLSKSYGDVVLFRGLDISVAKGQKVALVAANGTGKSTLLKILAGKDNTETGIVTYRRDTRIGYLEQDPDLDEKKNVLQAVFDAENPLMAAVREYEQLIDTEHPDPKKLEIAIGVMDNLNAWDYEARAKNILSKLGISHPTQLISELSGGQRKRVALARVLIQDPDFLILDEPTNHLDLDMIEWLEEYLSGLHKTILMVTHDRYFLENITDHILELDQGQIFIYKGNYAYFLEKKADREMREYTELKKVKSLYLKELDWIRRMPKARTTKSKARTDSFYDIEKAASKNLTDQTLKLDIKMSRAGSKILEARFISKVYNGKTVVPKFTYIFKTKDRIGIAGKNGAGKSTLIKILMGLVEPDTGKVEPGESTVFGYYSQDGLVLKEDMRVIDFAKSYGDIIPTGDKEHLTASQFLQRFLFPPAKQQTYISKLSGGEKRRLHLLSVLIKNPNFLILDEPTNDLDLLTLATLEEFLLHFKGCLIIVSHDRYFMDKLIDHLFVFEEDGSISDFPGNYTDYRKSKNLKLDLAKKEEKALVKKEQEIFKTTSPKKVSFKQKREFELLEKEIEMLEGRKEYLIRNLNSGEGKPEELKAWSKELDETLNLLDIKSIAWIEMADEM